MDRDVESWDRVQFHIFIQCHLETWNNCSDLGPLVSGIRIASEPSLAVPIPSSAAFFSNSGSGGDCAAGAISSTSSIHIYLHNITHDGELDEVRVRLACKIVRKCDFGR